jgi:outer membrane protein assembly factor BamB
MPAISHEGDVIVASLSGRVARLSPQGITAWTADLGERIYASPLLLGDAVILGSDAKRVVALSLATGKKRWELDVDGEADTAAAETPDGALVIAAGRVLYGLRADGAVRFRLKVPRKIYSSPAIADDGTIYVGAQDHHLYAVSPRGTVVWSRDLGGDVDCSPAVGDDGTIYAASDAGQVVAIAPQGDERWRTTVGGFVRGGLTVSRSGSVLAGTYGPGPRVVALDGATGVERWSFHIQGSGAAEFGIHGAPLEDAEGNLYLGAHDDSVYALDPAGRLRWAFPTRADVDAPLTIGPGSVLYVGSDDGHLYALH